MDIDIRKATIEDVNTLVEFNRAMALETEGKSLSIKTLARGVRAVFDFPARGWYLIAFRGGMPVGSLLITPEWSDWRNADYWWIQSVYVRPAYRGRGVYRALHRHVLNLAGENAGVCGLRLYVDSANTSAKAVYEKMGLSRSRYDFYEAEKPPEHEQDRD